MTKRFRDEIDWLRACEEDSDLPDAEARLSQGLASENNLVVERAATIAGAQKREALEDDLRTAYERVLLMSIGLLSLPEAVDYPLSVVDSPDGGAAGAAIRALSQCRNPPEFRQRLAQMVHKTRNPRLARILAVEFS